MKRTLSAVLFILAMFTLSSCDTIPLWGNDNYVDRDAAIQNTSQSKLNTESSD